MAMEIGRAGVAAVLESARVVAVLGAHSEPARAAFYVPAYLVAHGYRVLPINPKLVGQSLWNERVRATLTELDEAVDVVDVFRPSERVLDHVDEILAMTPLPKVVWMQLGVRNDAAAARLIEAGIDVVQDLCMLAEHRRLAGV